LSEVRSAHSDNIRRQLRTLFSSAHRNAQWPRAYTEFSDFQKKITDPSLRRQAEAQKCWLSVDMAHKNTTSEDAYRFIEQVLAKLAPADAAFLVHPSKLVTIPFDDDVRHRMASGSQAVSPQ
jgi:hypothetical protein